MPRNPDWSEPFHEAYDQAVQDAILVVAATKKEPDKLNPLINVANRARQQCLAQIEKLLRKAS